MKIYQLLKSHKGLIQIITYPENPETPIELMFERTDANRTISYNDIPSFLQNALKTKAIGEDLALAISNDYPLLFNTITLTFPSQQPVFPDELFSNNWVLKGHAQQRLSVFDDLIERAPHNPLHKYNKALFFFDSGHYRQAKSDFEAIEHLFDSDENYKMQIEQYLDKCTHELSKAITAFQTPFHCVCYSAPTLRFPSKSRFFSANINIGKEEFDSVIETGVFKVKDK